MMEFVDGMLKSEFLTYSHQIINPSLSQPGVVKGVVAIEHRTAGETLRTKFRSLDNRPMGFAPLGLNLTKILHTVLKVTLRSGEKFAINLAGAQHENPQSVVPWAVFEAERISYPFYHKGKYNFQFLLHSF
jgi:hypothetical protein